MKKILFLFGFLVCSFGVFASNGIIDISIHEQKGEIPKMLSEEIPNVTILIIDQGTENEYFDAWDDGNDKCMTIIRVVGRLSYVSQVGTGCP